MINEQLKNQLVVNGWVMLTLVIGFFVSIMIPKLSIIKLGDIGYGLYGLIVGFSGVLAFADLGLIPGLVRCLAQPIASGEFNRINAVIKRIDRLVLAVFLFLVVVCLIVMYFSIPVLSLEILHTFFIFSIASYYAILAEIRSALLRTSGAVMTSYILRSLYLLTYLLVIYALYLLIRIWNGVWIVCYAQLFVTVIYFICIRVSLNQKLHITQNSKYQEQRIDTELQSDFWKEAWRISSPERLNRVLQLVVGIIERPLLLVTAGLALVTSYDLLMRLMLLVSAIPGALNQPLLTMLAHDSVRKASEHRFPMALYLTKIIGLLSAVVGLICALISWVFFHESIFGIPSQIPIWIGSLIAFVAAVNVLTAPGSAALVTRGVTWPLHLKIYTETVGVVIGCAVALWFMDGFIFITIRNFALGLSAIIFLIIEYVVLKDVE